MGQFQQSTIWARAKASEGWRVVRLVLTVDEEIVGGFQILWRPSWRGRVAYDRSKALTILNGKSFTPEQVKSRYMFLARMGGSPRLLPETRVYFANPIFRFSYRAMFEKKIRQAEDNCRLRRA